MIQLKDLLFSNYQQLMKLLDSFISADKYERGKSMDLNKYIAIVPDWPTKGNQF